MTAIFPGDIKSFTPVIDNFDVVEAANINPVYEEITSIETWLERTLPMGYHANTTTMTTDVTFTDTDFPIQYLDPTTDGFVVNLPSTTDTNHIYYICNSSTSTALSIYSGTDEVTQIAAEKSATLISNGTTWAALTGGDPIVYSASVLDVTDTDTAGSSDSVARGDHRHKLAVTAPLYFDSGNLKLRYGTGLTVTSGSLVATGGSTDTGTGGIGQNFIINGDFRIHQRGNSGNLADDTYCRDRWILLSSTNSSYSISGTTSGVEMSTDAAYAYPEGIGHYALLIRASGYANEQAGLFQVIENINTRPLLNTDVSLSFWAKKYSATDNYIDNLKAVVLAWSSTSSSDIDAVTSDCVATWGNTLTYATGWTAENTPSDLALTTDWQEFKIESISIDTEHTQNLGVLIYISDTDTASSNNNGVHITGVKLELGTAATSFVPRLYSDELELCQRYCFVINTTTNGIYLSPIAAKGSTAYVFGTVRFPLEMRGTPTMTSNITGWDTDTVPDTTKVTSYNYATAAMVAITGTVSFNFISGKSSGRIAFVATTSFNGTDGDFCDMRIGPDVLMIFSAEL